MKVAVLSEGSSDEAAIRILVEGILGQRTEQVGYQSLRSRGWPSVLDALPAVIKRLHYHTDAEACVFVVDSNHSPVHEPAHELQGGAHRRCRLCQSREVVGEVLTHLRPVPNRPLIKIAIGLAVPSIEAWFRCGIDPNVTESAWIQGLQIRRDPYNTGGLKQAVYGVEIPNQTLRTERAVEEAHRLCTMLDFFEQVFPNGFGSLAENVRAW